MAEVEQNHWHRGKEFEFLQAKVWEINSDEDVYYVFRSEKILLFY